MSNNNLIKSQGSTNYDINSLSENSQHRAPPKPKRPKRLNQFKAMKMDHESIIGFLFEQCQNPISINYRLKPKDLDST
jgi:hypothetical protein